MIIPFFMHIHLAVIFDTDIFPLAVPHCEIWAIFAYFRPLLSILGGNRLWWDRQGENYNFF